jgi:hypothetical protein
VEVVIGGDEPAQAGCGNQRQAGPEAPPAAVVADGPLSVSLLGGEAETPARQPGIELEMLALHLAHGALTEQPQLAQSPPLKMGEHEARHVRSAGHEIPGRTVSQAVETEILMSSLPEQIGARHVWRHRCRDPEGAAGHPQRREDLLLHVVAEVTPRGELLQVTRQGVTVIRVADEAAGRHHPRRHPGGQVIAQRRGQHFQRLGGVEEAIVKAAGVGEQVAQGNRLSEGLFDVEVLQAAVHVHVELELALLDELHHRGGDEELRDGGHPEERPIGLHRTPGLQIRHALAPGQHHRPVAHDHHHGPGNVMGPDEASQKAIEVVLQPRRRCAPGGSCSQQCRQKCRQNDRSGGNPDHRPILSQAASPVVPQEGSR